MASTRWSGRKAWEVVTPLMALHQTTRCLPEAYGGGEGGDGRWGGIFGFSRLCCRRLLNYYEINSRFLKSVDQTNGLANIREARRWFA